MRPIITLTTDFGLEDGYVGTMKGVILGINPEAAIVDLSHQIAPQNVRQAAYVLAAACPHFPQGTIHVVVVDPGVGSERRAIALETPTAHFVAPDNGVLSYILAELGSDDEFSRLKGTPLDRGRENSSDEGGAIPPGCQAVHLNNPRYWLAEVSSTFHGRDIFAPVAAHLSLGVPLEELGEPIEEIVVFPIPRPELRADGTLVGHVIHIDRFGNLITDVKGRSLHLGSIIEVKGREIQGVSRSYADVEEGELLALIGSSGRLELSVREGSAAQKLQAKVGDEVVVSG